MIKCVLTNFPSIYTCSLCNNKEYAFSNTDDQSYNYVFLVKNGSITFFFKGEYVTIKENEYAFFSENDQIDFTFVESSNDVLFYNISFCNNVSFSNDLTVEETEQPTFFIDNFGKIKKIDKLEPILQELLHKYVSNNYIGCMSSFLGVLDLISHNDVFYSYKDRNYYVAKIKKYILHNFSQDLSLEEICNFAEISTSHANKLFRKHEGISIKTYLNQYRIKIAKEKINEGRFLIEEIANYVGFSNSTYFYKVFKKSTGMTPMQYYQKNHFNYYKAYALEPTNVDEITIK